MPGTYGTAIERTETALSGRKAGGTLSATLSEAAWAGVSAGHLVFQPNRWERSSIVEL